MKLSIRFAVLPLVSLALATVPARAVLAPAPQFQSTCYSIQSLPCIDCPGQRSKFCIPDPSGAFQTCSETTSNCDATHHCSQVMADTGPACDH